MFPGGAAHAQGSGVQLVAALVHAPEVLVLGEPLAGLDLTGIDVIGQGPGGPGSVRAMGAGTVEVMTADHPDLERDDLSAALEVGVLGLSGRCWPEGPWGPG